MAQFKATIMLHTGLKSTCIYVTDLLALLCVMFSCVFVTFPYGVQGQGWLLIVLIPDLCRLLYFLKSP